MHVHAHSHTPGLGRRLVFSLWITAAFIVVRVIYEDCLAVPDTVRLGGQDGRLAIFVADLEEVEAIQ